MQRLSVVVVHGSYSEIYHQEFLILSRRIAAAVDHPVLAAYLECTDTPLPEAIAAFVGDHHIQGKPLELQIFPLFLSPGMHVREDIPEAIAALERKFPEIQIKQLDYLGKNKNLSTFLSPYYQRHPEATRILLAHGSSRPGAKERIETLAHSLNAYPAFWVIEPSLETVVNRIIETAQADSRPLPSLCIVTYFLFSGKIPTALSEKVKALQQEHPHLPLYLGSPFGTNPECAQAIATLLTQPQ